MSAHTDPQRHVSGNLADESQALKRGCSEESLLSSQSSSDQKRRREYGRSGSREPSSEGSRPGDPRDVPNGPGDHVTWVSSSSTSVEKQGAQPQSDEVDFSIEKAQLLHGQIVNLCAEKELDLPNGNNYTTAIRQHFPHIDKYIPRDPVTGELESLGSVFHRTGNCKRCCFFTKNTCHKAELCLFCHAEHEEGDTRQRLSRRVRLRLRNLARKRAAELNEGVDDAEDDTAVNADIDDVEEASNDPAINNTSTPRARTIISL